MTVMVIVCCTTDDVCFREGIRKMEAARGIRRDGWFRVKF